MVLIVSVLCFVEHYHDVVEKKLTKVKMVSGMHSEQSPLVITNH